MPDGSGAELARIEETVRAVLGSMAGDLSAMEAALLSEIEGLGRTVARVKQEVAWLKADDITASHIPSATDELDAIVDHTAGATNAILDCCDILEGVATRIGGVEAMALSGALTRIYEACSFQDITGQRIGKVVAALKAIEARIASVTGRYAEVTQPLVEAEAEGRRLAEGPQLPGVGVSQADIDKLLSEF